MKKLLLLALAVVACGLAALGWTFSAQRLPVGPAPAIAIPPAHPPAGMTLSALMAGKMFSPAAFAYRGGGFADERVFGMGSILVQHPQGTLLFDAGFGKNVDAHFRTIPWIAQVTSKYEKETTVAEQLRARHLEPAALKAVIPTHAHWDHVSGLEDMPGAAVWVTQAERDFIASGHEMSALARSFGALNYHVYDFPNGPYLGFAHSYDVFGDGSVVLVPAPGHTPGSIIAFIALPSGKRYALIGDIAWQKEGVDLPAEKPWVPRRIADDRPDQVRALLVQLHQLQQAIPGLVIVPAHDRRVWESLPTR